MSCKDTREENSKWRQQNVQRSCRRMLDVFKEKLVIGDMWLEPNENGITCPDLFSEGVSAVELLSARMRVGIRA